MLSSVLICDPDGTWANNLKSYLTDCSYYVEHVSSGKECQLSVYQTKFLAVVLDLETKNHSALEVLKYLRLNAPSVKVILSILNRKKLADLEITEAELRKLGASDILIKPYEFEKVKETIEGVSQFESWKTLGKSTAEHEEEEVQLDDNEFTRVGIQNFYSGNTAIFDCYIRLGLNKYIKILHRGDFFDEKRIEKYKNQKEVEHLYFRTRDRATYINFINDLLEKMLRKTSEKIDKKIQTTKNLVEKYIEEIYTVGLKPQLVEEGKKICENMYNLVKRDPDLTLIMSKYEDYDPPAFAHLFLVSFMSAIACKNLEWSSQRTVELITFGAFLHDIGTLKLPPDIREENVSKLSPSQFEKYKEHPKFGVEMLQNCTSINEPIKQIVYQHHEYVNGEGFPNGLTGMKIYPLAKVVALANEFSTFLATNKVTPIQGLRQMIPNKANIQRFDPIVIKALIRGFIRDK